MTVFKFIRQYALRILLTTIFLAGVAYVVDARPGGGHSSRGRSRSRSYSRSSGGGGGLHFSGDWDIEDIIFVIFIILVIVSIVQKVSEQTNPEIVRSESDDDSSSNADGHSVLSHAAAMRVEQLLEELRKKDPNFSKTLFLDFVQSVVYEYFKTKGTADAQKLKPFFEPQQYISTNGNVQYSEIVINALRIVRGQLAQYQLGNDSLTVALDLNYTTTTDGMQKRYYCEQQWIFIRNHAARSLSPEKMQLVACPSCGAPNSFADGKHCDACGTHVQPAAKQWAVQTIENLYVERFIPSGLVEYTAESGTNLSTVVQDNLPAYKAQFVQAHGLGDFNSYWSDFIQNVVEPSFKTIYDAWATKRWDRARHLVSDHFYQTQNFWIEEYKRNNYTNRLDDVQIGNVQLAHMEADKFYETFTVRIFASCLDYTLDSNGAVIGGSRTTPRKFSEYWTFVRRVGVEHQQHDWIDMDNCPACSAPLDKMGMSGVCGYCGHKITSGEFSWVLSRITQDEAYA